MFNSSTNLALAGNGSRLCEAVDFEKTNIQLKTKDKMKNKSKNLEQTPPFCKTDVGSSNGLIMTAVEFLAERYNYITWMRNRDEISASTADEWRAKFLKEAKEREEQQLSKAWHHALKRTSSSERPQASAASLV